MDGKTNRNKAVICSPVRASLCFISSLGQRSADIRGSFNSMSSLLECDNTGTLISYESSIHVHTPYHENPYLCSNKSAYWCACCFSMCTHSLQYRFASQQDKLCRDSRHTGNRKAHTQRHLKHLEFSNFSSLKMENKAHLWLGVWGVSRVHTPLINLQMARWAASHCRRTETRSKWLQGYQQLDRCGWLETLMFF